MARNFSKVVARAVETRDFSKMGIDKRGIKRGACIECRECDDYETPKDGHNCDYCGCKPPKHPSVTTNDIGTDGDDTRTAVKRMRLQENFSHEQQSEEVSNSACSHIDECDEPHEGESDDDDTNIIKAAQNLNDDGKFVFIP